MKKTIGEDLEIVTKNFQLAKKLKNLADSFQTTLDMYNSCKSMHKDPNKYDKMVDSTILACKKMAELLNDIKKNFNIE